MKTRKQGNALVLTIPAKFNIQPDQEFVAVKGELGSIIYIPKKENIFKEAANAGDSLRFDDEFALDDTLFGREEI